MNAVIYARYSSSGQREESIEDQLTVCTTYAVISPTQEVVNGKIYALNINGYDATIKRVQKLNNGFILLPDSTDPTFEPQTFDINKPETENVRIIGRVVTYVLPPEFEL